MHFTFFDIIDILGTLSFAISGTSAAMRKQLDIFGIVIIAFVTAIGGGTLRYFNRQIARWVANGRSNNNRHPHRCSGNHCFWHVGQKAQLHSFYFRCPGSWFMYAYWHTKRNGYAIFDGHLHRFRNNDGMFWGCYQGYIAQRNSVDFSQRDIRIGLYRRRLVFLYLAIFSN
jgi:hypothetical protein